MKYIYEIVGLKKEGNAVVLLLSQPITEKINPMDALENISGFISKVQTATRSKTNPDSIHISIDEWKKQNYQIGDFVSINIEPEY